MQNLESKYNHFIKAGVTSLPASYAEFETAMKDKTGGAQKIYDGLKNEGVELPDFNEFYSVMMPEETKVQPAAKPQVKPATQSQQAVQPSTPKAGTPMTDSDKKGMMANAEVLKSNIETSVDNTAQRLNNLAKVNQPLKTDVKLGTQVSKVGDKYITTAGNDYDTPEQAKVEQFMIDESQSQRKREVDMVRARELEDDINKEKENLKKIKSTAIKTSGGFMPSDGGYLPYDPTAASESEKKIRELEQERRKVMMPMISGQLTNVNSRIETLNDEINNLKGGKAEKYSFGPSATTRVDDKVRLKNKELSLAMEERDALELMVNGEDNNFFSGLIYGITRPSTYTFGLYDLAMSQDMLNAKNAYDKGALTDDQKQFMAAYERANTAKSELDQNAGSQFRFGNIAAQSAPFMLEFFGTGGMGGIQTTATALARLTAKKLTKDMAKGMAKNLTKGLIKNTGIALGDIAAAGTMAVTTGGARTASDIINRYTGHPVQTDTGFTFKDGTTLADAVYKGLTSSTIEYYTEMLGTHMESVFPWIKSVIGKRMSQFAENVKGTKMGLAMAYGSIGLKKLGELADKSGIKAIYNDSKKAMKLFGLQSYPYEALEEEAGIVLNSMLTGDNKISDLVDGRTQEDIWGGMLYSIGMMQGITGGISAKKYYGLKHKLSNQDVVCSNLFGDQWASIKEQIDNATNANLLKTIFNVRTKSAEERKALLVYGGVLSQFRGFNSAVFGETEDKAANNAPSNPVSDAVNRGFTDGYNSADEETARIEKDLNDKKNLLNYDPGMSESEQFQSDVVRLQDNQEDALDYLIERYGEQHIGLATDYYNALNVYNGLTQRKADEDDDRLTHLNQQAERNEYKGQEGQSGNVITADMGGNKVYIVRGDVNTETGEMSGAIVVRDEQGKIIVTNGNALTLESVRPLEEIKQENAEIVAAERLAKEQEMKLAEEQQQEEQQIDQQQQPQDQPQDNQEQPQDNQEQQQDNQEQPQEPIEEMPMIGEGEEAEPDFYSVAPSRSRAFIYDESDLSEDEANEYVDANIEESNKKVKSLEKKKPKASTSINKYKKELDAWKQELEQAKKKADYWQQVKMEQSNIIATKQEERRLLDEAENKKAVEEELQRQQEITNKRKEQERIGANAVHPAIREKWDNSPKIDGAENELVLANGEKIKGRYVLVESGAATPSHNPMNGFTKNDGFPVDENGHTINDRDYERDKEAQDITRQTASSYDSRALQDVPVVSSDGVVLSGNGRTMAGELAARDNTDGDYIEHLQKYPEKFGFTKEQVSSMKHPRVLFVTSNEMPYNADTFSKFNAQDKKAQSRTEQSIKLGKTVDDSTFERIVQLINMFDSIADFYNNAKATAEAISELQKAGVINAMQYAEMFDSENLSGIGRQMLENMLVGKFFQKNPEAIRQLSEIQSLRQNVISALAEISNNRKLGNYSLERELAQAIDLAYQARKHGFKHGDKVSGYARQMNLFPFEMGETVADYTNATILMLANILNDKRTNKLKNTLTLYNRSASDSAIGQMDLFTGSVRTKEEIIKDILKLLDNGTKEEQESAINDAVERRKADSNEQDDAVRKSVEKNDKTSNPLGRTRNRNLSKWFGPIYTQFEGKANEAESHLRATAEGVAKGALVYPGVSPIDLVWGDMKAGYMKIVIKHPEVVGRLQEILSATTITSQSDNRIVFESDTHKMIVSRMKGSQPTDNWLLTAYEKKEKPVSASSSDIETEPEGKRNGTATPQNGASSADKVTNTPDNNQGETEKKDESKSGVKESRVVGGNSGYVGYSMSKRAAQAREKGRFPKTDFKKVYGLSDRAFDMLVRAGIIDDSEWHHTSKFGNKTTFYSWAEDVYAEIYAANKKEFDAIAKKYNFKNQFELPDVGYGKLPREYRIEYRKLDDDRWKERNALRDEYKGVEDGPRREEYLEKDRKITEKYDSMEKELEKKYPEYAAYKENEDNWRNRADEISRDRKKMIEEVRSLMNEKERDMEMRDVVIELLQQSGIEVITNEEEAQRVLDEANRLLEHRVYHGSAADFDAFDHSHMGEGEGAQAYGWGTYVTEVDGIGISYAKSSKRASGLIRSELEFNIERAKERLPFVKGDAKKELEAEIRNLESQLENLDEAAILYTVEIPKDDGTNYLHWEETVSDDIREKVKERVLSEIEANRGEIDDTEREMLFRDVTDSIDEAKKGKDLYQAIALFLGSEKTSQFLSSLGYVGISYPAQYRSGGREDGARNYVIFNESDAKITDKVRFFKTPSGNAYGFTVDGKIYVDKRIAGAETPIHEYTHLWAAAMRQVNQEEWKNIVSLMKGTTLWDEVKKMYPELTTDDDIADEVLAHYSGKRGAERLKKAQEEAMKQEGLMDKAAALSAIYRVKEALSRFWKGVADFLGAHFTSAEEVADKVLSDMLNGVNPTNVAKNGKLRMMGSRVDGRMVDIGLHFEGRELGVNERAVVDVYSGKAKNGSVTMTRDGKEHKIVMRQGTENRAGTKHSLLRHYGTGVGTITAEDLLLIPEVIERGEMEQNGKKRVYRMSKDGVRYTVLSEVNNGREDFSDFYSNRKGGDTSSSNTQLSARDYDATTNSTAKVVESFESPSIEEDKNELKDENISLTEEDANLYRQVEDEETEEWLEGQPTIKTYRSMVLIDGKLYPPMSSKAFGSKELRNPSELGKWEEAEEAPDKAKKKGDGWYYTLTKDNGKQVRDVAYNPYIHTSTTMLNDQFSEAQSRDNLVVVEMEVPASELSSGYKAEKATDSVGVKQWKAGVIQGKLSGTREVVLTRWAKPVRVVPVEEVADNIVEMIDGKIDVMPSNVVTPQQRKALEERGIKFIETDNSGKIKYGENAGKTWASVYGGKKSNKANKQETKSPQNPKFTKAQEESAVKREKQRIGNAAREMAARLGIEDDVEFIETNEDLTGREATAKGWFNRKTGKIVVVLGNHISQTDVLRTIIHEGVAHYGLRKLLGERFDTFLDEVFKSAEQEVKESILELSKKHGYNVRTATEEYLASLAEKMDFEKAKNSGWWTKIKSMFLDMMRQLGLGTYVGPALTDNELRYLLWRSYENLAEPNRYNNPFAEAKDTSKQLELKVGGYENRSGRVNATSEKEGDLLFRDGDFTERDEAIARDAYERAMMSGRVQFIEEVQDSMRSLVELYKAILGKKTRVEDIEGFENPYMFENRLSSMNMAQQHLYFIDYMKPVLKAISRICKGNDKKREELINYMMAKHGLERNLVFARRDAEQKAIEEFGKDLRAAEKAVLDDPLDMDAVAALDDLKIRMQEREEKLFFENREKDYGGITGLMGIENLKDAEEAARTLVDDYEGEHDLYITDLWNAVNAATQATLEKIYESGIISKESYGNIRDMFEYYIPLQGWDETTSDEVYAYLIDRKQMAGAPIKHAKGRRSKADDPIATIGMRGEMAVMQTNRNLMKQTFLNFVLDHPSDLVSVSELWLEHDEVNDVWIPVFVDIEEGDTGEDIKRKTEAFEQQMEDLQKQDPKKYKKSSQAQNIPYKVVPGNLKAHQVIVKRNGKSYVLTINGNPKAAMALNGLTNPDVEQKGFNKIMNAATYVNRKLSIAYTTANINFTVSNFVRDMVYSNTMAWIKESPWYALNFHWNFGKYNPAMMRRLFGKWDNGTLNLNNKTEKLFYDFMKNGGETGFSNVRDIDAQKKFIISELKKENSLSRKAIALLTSQLDMLNRSIENTARFAAFVTSREVGRSIERSVYDAKEVSVNFNKKGSGGRFLGEKGQTALGNVGSVIGGSGRIGYVFWNAGIQGLSNIGKNMGRHKIKGIAGLAAMYVLGRVIPMLYGDDDDNSYYDIPEKVRRSNICIKVGEQWVTISLPIEFRAIYGLGELATGVESKNDVYTDKELAYQIGSQISQILPIDFLEGDGGVKNFVPTLLRPSFEAYINESWTGLPIYKDTPWNKNMPGWTKAYKNANVQLVDFAKFVSEITGGDEYKKGAIDINPAQVEHVLSGLFGGYVIMGNQLIKMAETATGERDFDWRNMIIANRVITNGDERVKEKRTTGMYYKIKEEVEENRRLINSYRKDEMDEKADKLETPEYENALEDLKESQKNIKDIKEMIDETSDKDIQKGLDKLIRQEEKTFVERHKNIIK